ncbi:OLC1v1020876C1 [Oldenlandia corymbosa var. corymbosa]|uniref:Growth-regulating factor n=1 Tax=Oldenlandia corymbosa var. corymbosa TaxID=529605 RepID=A0AAV1BWV4_OLDCO|nr:OLC1v1020876C1 [Oldenlandia corymbosa var. corymbosa]
MGETIKLELDHRHNHLTHDSTEVGYHHQYYLHHRHRRSSSIPRNTVDDDDDNDGGGGYGGGGGGPGKNGGGADEVERPNTTTTADASAATVRANSLPPFDIFLTNTNTFAAAFKPSGGGLAANLGLPFTPAQWKELERQAMIYKYMTASVPVPPNLLFSRDPSLPSWNADGAYLRYSGYNTMNKDMEPGRCKRTDGKKWRCSRDVAPHQKYCERHLHRGRPRSRKHVEQQLQTSSSPGQNNNGIAIAAVANNHNSKKSRLQTTNIGGSGCGGVSGCSSDQPIKKGEEALLLEEQNTLNQRKRAFDWSAEQQQWLHLMDSKHGMNAPGVDTKALNTVLQQQGGYEVEEPLNLFSYGSTDDFGRGNLHYNQIDHNQSHLLLNNFEGQQGNDPTRGFIDAWSNDQESRMPSSDQQNPWPYSDHSLTLSMALDAPGIGSVGVSRCSPVSWPSFHSGGPLAEVLGPSSSIPVGSNPASPYTGNGDSISPPATSVSSPTGILHRALFSHSDSSVDNSPTLGASNATTPDLIAFQWLN